MSAPVKKHRPVSTFDLKVDFSQFTGGAPKTVAEIRKAKAAQVEASAQPAITQSSSAQSQAEAGKPNALEHLGKGRPKYTNRRLPTRKSAKTDESTSADTEKRAESPILAAPASEQASSNTVAKTETPASSSSSSTAETPVEKLATGSISTKTSVKAVSLKDLMKDALRGKCNFRMDGHRLDRLKLALEPFFENPGFIGNGAKFTETFILNVAGKMEIIVRTPDDDREAYFPIFYTELIVNGLALYIDRFEGNDSATHEFARSCYDKFPEINHDYSNMLWDDFANKYIPQIKTMIENSVLVASSHTQNPVDQVAAEEWAPLYSEDDDNDAVEAASAARAEEVTTPAQADPAVSAPAVDELEALKKIIADLTETNRKLVAENLDLRSRMGQITALAKLN